MGCANNLITIVAIVKIGIEMIDTMCLSCYSGTLLMILFICFLLFHCLIDRIVIHILVFVDLLIVIDCYTAIDMTFKGPYDVDHLDRSILVLQDKHRSLLVDIIQVWILPI